MAAKDIAVLYKSDNFVVVNKSPDVKINSDDPKDKVTVATQLCDLYPDLVDSSLGHSFRFVHRLDYATSGALCVALTKPAARWAHKAFTTAHVTKHYLALVYGHVEGDSQDINAAIGEDCSIHDIHKMCTGDQPHCVHPRPAHTHLVVLQRGCYGNQPATKVLLIPRTGRTHQLRVHCLHIGHRIVGDYMYSGREDSGPPRMMLHAYHLHMDMPQEVINISTEDPFVPGSGLDWHPHTEITTYDAHLNISTSGGSDCVDEPEMQTCMGHGQSPAACTKAENRDRPVASTTTQEQSTEDSCQS